MLGISTWDLAMFHYMIYDLVLLEMNMSKIRMSYHAETMHIVAVLILYLFYHLYLVAILLYVK